jgi:hypothetical protein
MRTIYSTLNYLHDTGAKDGRERGLSEGASRQLGKLLSRHGKRRFGPPPDEQRGLLDRLVERAALPALEQVAGRFQGAQGWTDLLEGISAPEETRDDPEYLLPFEFDPEPMPPSIDEFAKVRKITGEPAIIHIRMQRLYQDNIGAVLYKEAQRLQAEHRCSVETAVMLLWQGADGPAMTGEYRVPGGDFFRYHLTRLWERDVDEMFDNLGTLAYAPLGKFEPERLPEVLRRLDEAIETQAKDEKTRENLWVVAYQGMGLRFPAERVHELLKHRLPFILGTQACRGTLSEGYYAGYSQGEADGQFQATRRWVLELGRQRLGAPPAGVEQGLQTIRQLDRLEQLAARVLKGGSWPEVLAPN